MLKQIAIATVVTTVTLATTAFAAAPSVTVNANGDVKTVHGQVTINAPAAQVWDSLTHYSTMKDYIPGYKKSDIIADNGSNKKLDLSVKVSKFLPALNYQVAVSENPGAHQITIQRISGAFKNIHATYKLIPNGAQTTLVYNLDIDLGNSVPPIGVEQTLKNSTAETLNAIDSHCAGDYHKSVIASN